MNGIKCYQDLEVWKKSLDLAESIYRATEGFPRNEEFGLKSQMRRAAVSVPSNIAEGHSRNSSGEFRQFLGVSKGSLAELETQIELASRLQYLDQQARLTLLRQCAEIGRMTAGLLNAISNPH